MFDFDDLAEPSAAEQEEQFAIVYELTQETVTHGNLKAVVRRRGKGHPKAPLAVLMLPGNPCVVGYHANQALPVAVDKAFGEAGFPVVRFDWDGTGMNAPGTHKPSEAYEVTMPDARKMYELARELGERIVVCPWNYSGTIASKMVLAKWEGVCAIVSLSFGYKQWELVAKMAHPMIGEFLKADFEQHSKLTVPAIYVFGDRDVHTPLEDMQRIVKGRPDGGSDATIHVIKQAGQRLDNTRYFMMTDKEDEAGEACASWLKDLRTKMVMEVEDSDAEGA